MTIYEELRGRAQQAGRFAPLGDKETDAVYIDRLAQAISGLPLPEFETMSTPAQQWFDRCVDISNGPAPRELPPPEGYSREAAAFAPLARPALARPGGPIQRPRNAAPEEPATPPEPIQTQPQPIQAELPIPNAPRWPETPPVLEVVPETPPEAVAAPETAVVDAPAEPTTVPVKEPRRRRGKQAAPPAAHPSNGANTGNGNGHDHFPAPAAAPAPKEATPSVKNNAGVSKQIRRLVIANPSMTVNELMERLLADGFKVEDKRPSVSTLRYDTLATIEAAKEAGWSPSPR